MLVNIDVSDYARNLTCLNKCYLKFTSETAVMRKLIIMTKIKQSRNCGRTVRCLTLNPGKAGSNPCVDKETRALLFF